MLNKTKTISVLLVMVAVTTFGGFTLLNADSVEIRSVDSTKPYPQPPQLTLDSYGPAIDIDYLHENVDGKLAMLNTDEVSTLRIFQARMSHGGDLSMFYLPSNDQRSFVGVTTVDDFMKQGGILVRYQELILNSPVENEITEYVKITGNEDAGTTINGHTALLISENPKFDLPPKIKIYDEDHHLLISIVGWKNLAELKTIAEKIQ